MLANFGFNWLLCFDSRNVVVFIITAGFLAFNVKYYVLVKLLKGLTKILVLNLHFNMLNSLTNGQNTHLPHFFSFLE